MSSKIGFEAITTACSCIESPVGRNAGESTAFLAEGKVCDLVQNSVWLSTFVTKRANLIAMSLCLAFLFTTSVSMATLLLPPSPTMAGTMARFS